VCVTVPFQGSVQYVFPVATVPIYSLTVFTGSDCAAATLISGPDYKFGLDTTCTGGSGYTMVNGPLQYCLTTCNADCTNIPTNECVAGSTGSGGGIYSSNGVGAQAVVTYATAALIAVAAVVLSL
jgi:phage baseplate assembly protein gpV